MHVFLRKLKRQGYFRTSYGQVPLVGAAADGHIGAGAQDGLREELGCPEVVTSH